MAFLCPSHALLTGPRVSSLSQFLCSCSAMGQATPPQSLVVISLDTTGSSRQNPRQQFCTGRPRELLPDAPYRAPAELAGPLRECACSICPVSPCNALIHCATCAAIGFVPMPPAPSPTTAAVPAAATSSAMFLRRSARASACARARSQRARPSALAPAERATTQPLPIRSTDFRPCLSSTDFLVFLCDTLSQTSRWRR